MDRFTAVDARHQSSRFSRETGLTLDQTIRNAVNDSTGNRASMRVYRSDPWLHRLELELEERGFKNINVPEITIKGDVHFEWDE
jgi:hypothetical protein